MILWIKGKYENFIIILFITEIVKYIHIEDLLTLIMDLKVVLTGCVL